MQMHLLKRKSHVMLKVKICNVDRQVEIKILKISCFKVLMNTSLSSVKYSRCDELNSHTSFCCFWGFHE